MSLFCNKTCECKNRCDADLQWNKDAKKACREACKGDDTLDPYTWLQSQPAAVQALYNFEPNQVQMINQVAGGPARSSEPGLSYANTGFPGQATSSSSGISTGMIAVGVAIIIVVIVLIKRKK